MVTTYHLLCTSYTQREIIYAYFSENRLDPNGKIQTHFSKFPGPITDRFTGKSIQSKHVHYFFPSYLKKKNSYKMTFLCCRLKYIYLCMYC